MPAYSTPNATTTASQLWYHNQPEHCSDFGKAWMYAKSLNPNVELGYIPKHKHWGCKWVGNNTLKCPIRGVLCWCARQPQPKSTTTMQCTQLYVIGGSVSCSIKYLVQNYHATWEYDIEWCDDGFWIRDSHLNEWISIAIENWNRQVPSGYWGKLQNLRQDEVYKLVGEKVITKHEFHEWLNQWAWDTTQIQLNHDMAMLAMGPAPSLLEELEAAELLETGEIMETVIACVFYGL
ncbi:hypothetical protein FRC08_006504 [Ceratobasidium sp. 394]|nr:hypothetical protein FRC08_006504 [Ceratobasidium sp. 394]